MILYIVKYSVTQGKILHQDILEMKEIGDEHIIMQNRKKCKIPLHTYFAVVSKFMR